MLPGRGSLGRKPGQGCSDAGCWGFGMAAQGKALAFHCAVHSFLSPGNQAKERTVTRSEAWDRGAGRSYQAGLPGVLAAPTWAGFWLQGAQRKWR